MQQIDDLLSSEFVEGLIKEKEKSDEKYKVTIDELTRLER